MSVSNYDSLEEVEDLKTLLSLTNLILEFIREKDNDNNIHIQIAMNSIRQAIIYYNEEEMIIKSSEKNGGLKSEI
jgi:hypothetical protein